MYREEDIFNSAASPAPGFPVLRSTPPDSGRRLCASVLSALFVPEVVKREMPWKCVDCHAKFRGPRDRAPKNGCPVCGSRNVFDCNVERVGW